MTIVKEPRRGRGSSTGPSIVENREKDLGGVAPPAFKGSKIKKKRTKNKKKKRGHRTIRSGRRGFEGRRRVPQKKCS